MLIVGKQESLEMFGVYLISPPMGLILARTDMLLKQMAPDDEDPICRSSAKKCKAI